MNRARSEGLDTLLGERFKVLDDGFVIAVDYMGSDASIERAARVSYGEGTRAVSDRRSLLRYLMRHRHTTPFEMCELTLHVRVPMDTWRQWIRHRTASVNEYSTRYSEAIDSMAKTQPHGWRAQSKTNKQGSQDGGKITWPNPQIHDQASTPEGELTEREVELHKHAREVYEQRLRYGVAREQARKDLPLSTYTEAYWKIDAHNLMHFLSLRMGSHAQYEIRQYASAIYRIFEAWLPITAAAFADYRLSAVTFSRAEQEAFKQAINVATLFVNEDVFPTKREYDEFIAKLAKLGLRG